MPGGSATYWLIGWLARAQPVPTFCPHFAHILPSLGLAYAMFLVVIMYRKWQSGLTLGSTMWLGQVISALPGAAETVPVGDGPLWWLAQPVSIVNAARPSRAFSSRPGRTTWLRTLFALSAPGLGAKVLVAREPGHIGPADHRLPIGDLRPYRLTIGGG